MSTIIPLDQMTTPEKLRLMEELWSNLSRNEQEFDSPAWHEVILKEREERLGKGEETPVDWEKAKEELRNRLT